MYVYYTTHGEPREFHSIRIVRKSAIRELESKMNESRAYGFKIATTFIPIFTSRTGRVMAGKVEYTEGEYIWRTKNSKRVLNKDGSFARRN